MKRMKLVVLGTQASGKGTQAHILSVIMGVPAVSVGDLLRDLQGEDSARGREAKLEMSKGAFVDDTIILPLLKNWLETHQDGWIIDGFPRSVEQAEKSEAFFKPDACLYLEVPDEESKRRILYRRICTKCKTNYNLITQPPQNPKGLCDKCGGEIVRRSDDTPELVDQRLKHYHQVTEPLKDWYAKRGKLILIDARKSIAEVAREAQSRLEGRTGKKRRFHIWLVIAPVSLIAIIAGLTLIGYILNS